MKALAWLFLSGVSLVSAQDPQQLLDRAKQVLPDRNGPQKAEAFLRDALRAWDHSANPKSAGYAQASTLLALILTGRKEIAEARPLVEKAINIYDENPAASNALDLAMALELESMLVSDGGQAFKQRAAAIRARHIEELQSLEPTPPPPQATFRIGGGVSAPAVTYKVEPEYSTEARVAKYQGTAVVKVVVSPDGVARDIRLLRSLGLGLDEKAFEAVRKWRFRPGTRDGEPVAVYATIEVNFRLL